LGEALNLAGLLCVTALTINYAAASALWLQPWLPFDPPVSTFLVFWALFITLWIGKKLVLRYVMGLVKWEHFHWLIQVVGMVLGGVRGLWWSSVLLVACSGSGFIYLQQSVAEQSILGPRMLASSRQALEVVANRFPGAETRGKTLIPPARLIGK
jgi:uncharacterized membrane protein required for colicin V production